MDTWPNLETPHGRTEMTHGETAQDMWLNRNMARGKSWKGHAAKQENDLWRNQEVAHGRARK